MVTNRDGGYENLAHGRETQCASGHQALKKGTKASVETHRANGFQHLKEVSKKGHERQKAQKVARIVAVLDTHQARQLLAKPSGALTSKDQSTLQFFDGAQRLYLDASDDRTMQKVSGFPCYLLVEEESIWSSFRRRQCPGQHNISLCIYKL